MIIAIGRIMKENNIIGLRIFDTETKKTKDIRIEDEVKIKNVKSINKLGIVDNKQNDKPIIVIGYKDNKYLAVDINGNTKVLNSLNSYNTIDLLTNIEQYNKYIARYSLIGEQDFEFEIKEDTDEVIITKYIENEEGFRVLNIPTFVTSIKIELDNDIVINSPFKGVKQNLKVTYKGDKITSMKGMFYEYKGSNLDLSNFDTSQVKYMDSMFESCKHLKELDLSHFDTSKVTDMSEMFYHCEKLEKLDLSTFDTSKVTDMYSMFYNCKTLKELDLSNFDTSKVTDMHRMFKLCMKLEKLDLNNFDTSQVKYMDSMFYNCKTLKELDLSNFNTSKVRDMDRMFESCKDLEKLDLSNFNTSQVVYMDKMFDNTSLTPENTGLKVK